VEGPNDAVLHQQPETFNRVGVNDTHNVFFGLVLDECVRKLFAEFVVGPQIVSGTIAESW
jgi:hypothetical protein